MSRRKWYAVGSVVVVAALALAFGLAGGQEQSAPLAQGGLPPAGGINEGVQVHGHWTLEVREPDGSLVSRQEFENALDPNYGPQTLAEMLTGNLTAGEWEIHLRSSLDTPFRNEGFNSSAFIVEPRPGYIPPYFDNLDVSSNSSGVIILKGSAQAQVAGNITDVQTWSLVCHNNVSPSQCNLSNSWNGYPFTNTTLPQPVQLAADQWVTAEVDISFQ